VGGWMYLVAILDWYSRYVVSWELDQTLELPFVLTAVQRALGQTVPLICNSDQGSHFTSPQYCQLLQAANIMLLPHAPIVSLYRSIAKHCRY
jgi:putative transposase